MALLSTIPSEQYMGFERLRRENGAKTIQRNWRSMQMERQFGKHFLFVMHISCAIFVAFRARGA